MPGTWPTSATSRSSRPSICPSIDPQSTPSFTSSRPSPPTRSTRSSQSSIFSPAISSKQQPEKTPYRGYEVIRQLRWPDGVVCLHCSSTGVVRNGHDDRERHRQRYLCKACKYRFDDLTGTVLAGHHQPVSTWILGSYFMGVNLSNRQIAQELGVCESDAQAMTEVLRHGIVATTPDVVLSGDVEFDELYVVAGHKGKPEAVRAKGREGRRNRLKGGRGTLEKEKPPIFGMIERGGQVVIRMLANVQQAIRSSRSQRLERLYRRVSHLCQASWSRLQPQDRLSWSRRIRPRRGRRRVLRGQHPGGLLVAPAILAASRPLAGEAAALSRLLPVRSQHPQTGKGVARLLDRGAGHVSPLPITPEPDKSLNF